MLLCPSAIPRLFLPSEQRYAIAHGTLAFINVYRRAKKLFQRFIRRLFYRFFAFVLHIRSIDARSVTEKDKRLLGISLDTHLFLERRSVRHCVHNGVRNAGVQLSDSPLGIQAQRIVTTVDRHHEPLHCFHVTGPSQVQLGCWLRQATSARTIRSTDTFPSILRLFLFF